MAPHITESHERTNLTDSPVYTTSNGAPVYSPFASQRVGKNGPLLLQDFHLVDLLAHFDRERIPERVVHAKGAGAFGEFEVTHDVTAYTDAKFLNEIGKKTKVFTRFSTVGGEKGSADTARDPRGFAVKFYTEEGNWDMVGNNTPVFFLRDPAKFPIFIHTQKRNPQTNLKDANMFWDYLSSNPESVHQVMHLFSDRGTPRSYRFMNGYSSHTFKFTKADGSFKYVKFHFQTDQGSKTWDDETASVLSAHNPDYATQDLFEAIEGGDYPTWTTYVQVMDPADAEKYRWNIFDLTKVWPHSEYPLIPFGKLTLNRNPENYFAEVEQAAFSPSHLVPGIEPSADPVLQSRLFSYPDTHRHRLGSANYQQIPVNQPLTQTYNYQRDGFMAVNGNYGANPNYVASNRPVTFAEKAKDYAAHETWVGQATVASLPVVDDDFVQPNSLWQVIGREPQGQDHFVYNVSVHLSNARQEIRERQYGVFERVNSKLGKLIRDATEAQVKKKAGEKTPAPPPSNDAATNGSATNGKKKWKFGGL